MIKRKNKIFNYYNYNYINLNFFIFLIIKTEKNITYILIFNIIYQLYFNSYINNQ